jgi:hypothetical protein
MDTLEGWMTEGRDVPGDVEAPPADPTDETEPPADEPSSEPPTIGWATGVQWEPIDPNRRAPVPDRVRLQIGSVFGRTLDTFLRRPLFFVGLAVPSALIALAGPSANAQPTSIGPALLFYLLDIVVSVPFSVAMIVATDDLRADRALSSRSVIERALGRTVPALISNLVTGAATTTIVFLPAILAAPSLGFGGGGFVLLLLFGILAYVSIRLSVSQPAIALDQLGPIEGLKRSWSVTRGNMWKLIGLAFATGLLPLPLSVGAGLLSVNSSEILGIGVSTIATLIAVPLTAIAPAIAYGDLSGRPATYPLPGRGRRNRRLLVAAILGVGVVVCLIAIPKTRSASVEGPVAQVFVEVGGTIH